MTGHPRTWVLAALLALAQLSTSAGVARADEAEARRHWRRGEELYKKERYLDAAHEFEAGYEAAHRPLFKLNIGHAYRRANELKKAKDAYEDLLRMQPNFDHRDEVEGYIRSIDDALQAKDDSERRPANTVPPPPAPTTAAPTLVDPAATVAPPPPPAPLPRAPDPTPAPSPAATATLAESAPPASDTSESSSIFGKPWFWVIVGAAVAGGVAAAVIVTRPTSSCHAALCISEQR